MLLRIDADGGCTWVVTEQVGKWQLGNPDLGTYAAGLKELLKEPLATAQEPTKGVAMPPE
jgi:hypothetical protein